MTPNGIITLAKKRVKDASSTLEWNSFYEMTIDEIFTEKRWRFARQELNYIHPQSTGDKQFDADITEKALNRILEMRVTMSFALIGGIPQPTGNDAEIIDYLPLPDFRELYLDNVTDGFPQHFTIVTDNDGVSGMHIQIGPRPSADAAIFIDGDFIPTYVIDSNQMPILPKQFHRMVVDGVIHYAAEEKGMVRLSLTSRRRFDIALAKMDLWDIRNSKYNPVLKPYTHGRRKGPFFPSNFPRGYSR